MATVEEKPVDTVMIEVDGRELEARKGQMLIEVTDGAGIEIPRFCYHHKLSIAANCRMCLVDVEKAPKPLPACATPVADGMKVFTRSRRAVDAQRGVMEFLLINHPLDCPICDQGGECELQDLAMGYGRSISRFTERKRVVKDKNLGPLVATDMTRCIHCTRCVRFLEEIAGTAELGGVGRGENLEISTFIERNIDSELSGNIIDLCPVGALTNKPFRFTARAWEMSARPYVGTHDCLGSGLHYHVRRGEIMRAVPRDNEDVNECWLADRDRYSHFGLESPDRLAQPQIKRDGVWQETDWSTALEHVAGLLGTVVSDHGAEQLGFLVSPRATTEEHLLLRRIADSLGTPNIDHRLRIVDDSDPRLGQASLDRPTRDLSDADAVLMVGSHLRHDQPILNHRVRSAWRKRGAAVMDVNPVAWTFPFDMEQRLIVPPQRLAETLARVARAAFDVAGTELPDSALGRWLSEREPEPAARAIAERLHKAEDGFLVLGDSALAHPQAGLLRALSEQIARTLEIALMVLPGSANSQGGRVAGSVPGRDGMSASAQISHPRRGYVLFDLDPDYDTANPAATRRALDAADAVIAFATFAGPDLLETADVLLPLNAVPETDGSYINADGHRNWLKAASRGPAMARPGWKILRALGERLEVDGFDFTSLAEVDRMLEASSSDPLPAPEIDEDRLVAGQDSGTGFWRIGSVPMYAGDSLLRRSEPLQRTNHADTGFAGLHFSDAEDLGVSDGDIVRIRQGEDSVEVPVRIDSAVPPGAVWLPSATSVARTLGTAWGPIELERVS